MMHQPINPIENSLLQEVVDLYSDDLTNQTHEDSHNLCPLCSKQQILRSIENYRELERRRFDRASKKDCSVVEQTSFQHLTNAALNSKSYHYNISQMPK